MKQIFILFLFLGFGLSQPLADERPNFILCMADDLGWGDTGHSILMVT